MASPTPGKWGPTVGASLFVAVIGLAGPGPAPVPQVRGRLLAPVALAAGGKGTVALEMTLGSGWHVNSHRPLQSFLIPTTATLATSSGTLSEIRYPEPVTKRFAFADEPLAVYQGTVRFESELALAATATGKVTLGGVLAYQPCNDSQCFPPTKTILNATVDVAGPQAKGK